jgi:MFS family permease
MRDTPQPRNASDADEKATLREALVAFVGKPSALLLMAGVGAYLYSKYAFNLWIVDYLRRSFGETVTLGKAAFHAVFWFCLGSTIGVALAGRLSDRIAVRNSRIRFDMNILGLIISIPGFLLSAYAPNAPLCIVGTGIVGFAAGVYDSNFYASLFEVVKPRYRAAAVGVFGCGGAVIGAVGPAMLGWTSTRFSMSAGIASLSLVSLAGAIAILVARTAFFNKDKEQ